MRVLSPIFYLLSAFICLAQPQQAWVQRYNGGFTNQTHMPLAMKLDAAGNIYVAGSSQNASNFYDYVVLKYSPNGTQLFAARYSPTNGGTYPANGFALDQNGNTYLTGGILAQGVIGYPNTYVIGNGATVKFDASGQVVWAVPYTGNDVAVDTNGNVYVTGFSTTQYATAKLNAAGSNVWTRTYVAVTGPANPVAVSQKVVVNNVGNVFVAGWADVPPGFVLGGQMTYYSSATMLMYDGAGDVLWTNKPYSVGLQWGQIAGLILDDKGDLYVTGNSGDFSYRTSKIDATGQTIWEEPEFGPGSHSHGATAIAIDSNYQVYLTGNLFQTIKVAGTNGEVLWQQYQTSGQANGIAVNSPDNFYVTGSTNSGASSNDWETVKYDSNGNQQWVIYYNGTANGNDGATAIAVAPDGSIYVTGYSQNTSGGTDITTIKYGNLTNLQKKSDGSIQLQFFGTPSQSYNFQATTNFVNWTNLGSSLADTNGILEYLDTNASLFPYRFYRWYFPP